MVSKKQAKKIKPILEKVLETEEPTKEDLLQLFGENIKLELYMKYKHPNTNQMLDIAYQLTPFDCEEKGKRNYADETIKWQEKVIPQIKKNYINYYI